MLESAKLIDIKRESDLKIIVDISCVFHKDYFTFCNQDWNANSETNFGITCGKCLLKLLSDIVAKMGILEISSINFRKILILGLIWPGS